MRGVETLPIVILFIVLFEERLPSFAAVLNACKRKRLEFVEVFKVRFHHSAKRAHVAFQG